MDDYGDVTVTETRDVNYWRWQFLRRNKAYRTFWSGWDKSRHNCKQPNVAIDKLVRAAKNNKKLIELLNEVKPLFKQNAIAKRKNLFEKQMSIVFGISALVNPDKVELPRQVTIAGYADNVIKIGTLNDNYPGCRTDLTILDEFAACIYYREGHNVIECVDNGKGERLGIPIATELTVNLMASAAELKKAFEGYVQMALRSQHMMRKNRSRKQVASVEMLLRIYDMRENRVNYYKIAESVYGNEAPKALENEKPSSRADKLRPFAARARMAYAQAKKYVDHDYRYIIT